MFYWLNLLFGSFCFIIIGKQLNQCITQTSCHFKAHGWSCPTFLKINSHEKTKTSNLLQHISQWYWAVNLKKQLTNIKSDNLPKQIVHVLEAKRINTVSFNFFNGISHICHKKNIKYGKTYAYNSEQEVKYYCFSATVFPKCFKRGEVNKSWPHMYIFSKIFNFLVNKDYFKLEDENINTYSLLNIVNTVNAITN